MAFHRASMKFYENHLRDRGYEVMLNTDQKREANALRNPLKKTGTTRNIADMAEFMLFEKGSWISGQILRKIFYKRPVNESGFTHFITTFKKGVVKFIF
ncbi:MAG: hypothetical protein ABR597_14130 [Bacteroidales bacterium]